MARGTDELKMLADQQLMRALRLQQSALTGGAGLGGLGGLFGTAIGYAAANPPSVSGGISDIKADIDAIPAPGRKVSERNASPVNAATLRARLQGWVDDWLKDVKPKRREETTYNADYHVVAQRPIFMGGLT